MTDDLEEVSFPASCPGCGGPYPAAVLAREGQSQCYVCGGGARPERSVEEAPRIILPPSMQEDEHEGRHGHEHPRSEYVAAVFFGTQKQSDPCEHCGLCHDQQYLVEITEHYHDGWKLDDPPTYHYRSFDLTRGLKMAVKTIGFIEFNPESEEIPEFVDVHLGRGNAIGWRRLR